MSGPGSILQFALAFWVGGGLIAFSVWSVRQYATNDLAPGASWTAILIYRTGQALIWVAVLLMAGLLLGAAARAAWTLVG